MKKILALAMAAIFAISLLVACSGGGSTGPKNNGIVSTDMVDSSDTQQRWLRLPGNSSNESHLVINPAEYTGSASGNFNRLPLNVGYLDNEGNLKYTLDNAIFLVESNSANGVGGTQIFTPVYEEDAEDLNIRWSSKKLDLYVDGTKVTCTIKGDTPDTTATQTLALKDKLSVDFSKDLVACINVISCDCQWKLAGSTSKPATTVLAQSDTSATGNFTYNLTEIITAQLKEEDDTSATTLAMTLTVYGTAHTFVFSDYKYVAIDRGFNYAASDATTTWAPYAITSKLAYPNGTSATVADYFAGYHTVARQIKFDSVGTFYLAGKVDGKLTYNDKKSLLIVEGSDYNYVISPKRKQYVAFYESEQDMLKRVNGTAEPTSSSKYWTISCGRLEVGDELYVSIALDAKGGLSLDDLEAEAKRATSAGETAGRIQKNIEFWNEYLAAITIPSDFITKSAEDFAG